VLGPKLEVAFRQSVMISHGGFAIFVERPISLALLVATAGFLLFPLSRLVWLRLRRKPATDVPLGEQP
jgi:TctA family transporter